MDIIKPQRCGALDADGTVARRTKPENHGNPFENQGYLVTFHYKYELANPIADWTPFDVEILRYHDRSRGAVAEFTETDICREDANRWRPTRGE